MGSVETKNSVLSGKNPESDERDETLRLLPGVAIMPLATEFDEIYVEPNSNGQLKIPYYGLPTERQLIR